MNRRSLLKLFGLGAVATVVRKVPAPQHVALYDAEPSLVSLHDMDGNELKGAGYARVELEIAITDGAAGNAFLSFPQATGTWKQIRYVRIHKGANLLFESDLIVTRCPILYLGDRLEFAPGALLSIS